jgi:hypothetical protein
VPGKVIQMPGRAKAPDEVVVLQDAVMIFHESGNCPGMLAERPQDQHHLPNQVEVYCTECNAVIGSFLGKEWRSIVEFLALVPANDVA